jgi:peptidoglycan/xylan/chitin deacetylase (PgdA/CDA1 family)
MARPSLASCGSTQRSPGNKRVPAVIDARIRLRAGTAFGLALALALAAGGCDEESPFTPQVLDAQYASPQTLTGDSTGTAGDGSAEGSNDAPDSTLDEGEFVEINLEDIIERIDPATWFGDKQAACSLMFDDTRPSHYMVAAPELESHGLRGTFALVTGGVGDWYPWQELHDHGHEIANHTRDHYYFSSLTPEEVEAEIAWGRDDLLQNVSGLRSVPSFVYPGGDAPPWTQDIAARYHSFGRATQGIAPANPPNLILIPATGYYFPFSVAVMNRNLDEAIASGGWYIPYFHSILDTPHGSRLVCPLSVFRSHLDYIQQCTADVWVAPFGVVGRYIMERRGFEYHLIASPETHLYISTGLDPTEFDVPLTAYIVFKRKHGALIVTLDERSIPVAPSTRRIIVDLVPEVLYRIRVEQEVPVTPPVTEPGALAEEPAIL